MNDPRNQARGSDYAITGSQPKAAPEPVQPSPAVAAANAAAEAKRLEAERVKARDDKPKSKVLGTATWLGEGEGGPRVNTWNDIAFEIGKAVEITDPHMMAKAKRNRFYEAVEYEAKPEAPLKPPEKEAM